VAVDRRESETGIHLREGRSGRGATGPRHVIRDKRFVEFTKAFERQHKVVAAVCHGPQLLMTARLVKGRTLTAWPTIQDDLAP
jgi:protease I